MNYKLTNRERFLLKILGAVIFFISIYFIEMKLINNLDKSRDALNQNTQIYNNSKQELSQIKFYENNKENLSTLIAFEEFLKFKKYKFDNKDNVLTVTMLSQSNLTELLNFINGKMLNISSVNIRLIDDNNFTLRINFDN
tara:strand:- start:1065 stop:1484 length:420 start_codon:yes stop_codon:yes gene_type:complete